MSSPRKAGFVFPRSAPLSIWSRRACGDSSRASPRMRGPDPTDGRSAENDHHLAAGLTSLHDAMRFVDLLKAKHAGWFGLELAVRDLLRDFAERHVREREAWFAK